jgi:CRP-like cAMP-binding protein
MKVGFPHSRLIARLRAIASLTDADAALIEQLPMKLQNLADRHEVVQEGQTLSECCMLVDGFLMRHKAGPEGKRQIVSWHVPGDIPDLYSLHLNPIDHNISALGPAVVAFIPHDAINAMLSQSASLIHVLWRETLVDASVFREWMVSLGKRDAQVRIAHMICEMLVRLRLIGLAEENAFVFPASQVDISDAAGMTPVHANRMIQQLRATNLIKWDGPSIRVLDFEGLKAVAEFDDSYLHLRVPISTIARKHSLGTSAR